jgi:hypothetical protein
MRKLIISLAMGLLAVLLLASCTTNPIDTYLRGRVDSYAYEKTMMACLDTSWKTTKRIGSSVVIVDVITECKQTYYVEYYNENQKIPVYVYHYYLPNYKLDVYIWDKRQVLQGQDVIKLDDFLKELGD